MAHLSRVADRKPGRRGLALPATERAASILAASGELSRIGRRIGVAAADPAAVVPDALSAVDAALRQPAFDAARHGRRVQSRRLPRRSLTAENLMVLLNTIGISLAKTIPSLLARDPARLDRRAHRHAGARRAGSADHAAVLHSADPDRDGLGHARQPAGRRHQPGLAMADRLDRRRRSTSIPTAASSGT